MPDPRDFKDGENIIDVFLVIISLIVVAAVAGEILT